MIKRSKNNIRILKFLDIPLTIDWTLTTCSKRGALEDLDKYYEQTIPCYNEILEVEQENADAFYDMGLCRASLRKNENE